MFFSNTEIATIYKVAMYIRLSREDGDKQESESIGNQRAIIKRYIKENNLILVNEYVDDGISGTTFDRPGFSKMIHDIEQKQIDMVITKDLSRLGRDYIKTGYYLENYFPEHNVRYVAITDGIDTFIDSTNNDVTPFKAIMNDMYAKDISKKIRSVIKEKQKAGEYMCTIAPYGYRKDPNQKNHLIIDENVREIVENIFELYSKGKGTKFIRNYLNSKQIPSPLSYAKNITPPKKWNDVTILNMLKNEAYIGNTISNKRAKLSYKSKKRIKVPIKQNIIVENTHEAIISKEQYEKVQFYLSNKSMSKKTKHEFLFRGLLICHTCKRKSAIGSKTTIKGRVVSKPIPYITCTGSKIGKCPNQHMNYHKFETEILKYLKQFCNIYANKEILKQIYKENENDNFSIIDNYKKDITNINNKITTMSEQLDNIYFDKLNKIISETDYFRYSDKIISQRKELESRETELIALIKNIKKQQETKATEKEIENIINQFLGSTYLQKETLFRLIKQIEIDENKNVYVFFNFSSLNIINKSLNKFIDFKKIV